MRKGTQKLIYGFWEGRNGAARHLVNSQGGRDFRGTRQN